MRTKDISPGEYAQTGFPRSGYGRVHRVRVLRTAVERTVGSSYRERVQHDGVEIVSLDRETGRKHRGSAPHIVPAEQILRTWVEQEDIERADDEAAVERERQEMQHEALLAYACGRLAVLGVEQGFEDENYHEDWNHGLGSYLSFHPKALIALLDKLDHGAPSFTPTKRKGKLYVNGLVIAEDNGNGHFDHIYNALKGVAKHGTP